MNRSRALIVSLGVAVAAVAGIFAATNTISLGSEAKASTNEQVAERTAQLDRFEASLKKTLAQQPPKLPAMPSATTAATDAQSAAPAEVVYRRAAPVVAGPDHEEYEDEEHEDEDEGYEHEDEQHEDGRESDD